MTQEKERIEIIRMANEAGLCDSIWVDEESSAVNSVIYFFHMAQAAEREACAIKCEKADRYRGEYFAALIRSRGNSDQPV